jgi:hypothetical protein
MVKKMLKYLTSKYKCKDDDNTNMTPLEYASSLKATESVLVLQETLSELERAAETIEKKKNDVKSSKTFLQNIQKKRDYEDHGTTAPAAVITSSHAPVVNKDDVTTERVIQAKARLQAFQAQKKS